MRQREELDLLTGRITIIVSGILAAFGVLAFGFWSHQIAQSPYYQLAAERNSVRTIALVAPRGRIFDREHRILADSRPSYNLVLTREGSPRPPEQTIARLAAAIQSSEADLLARLEEHRGEPEYRPIVLQEDVPVADIAYVRAHQYELPELSVEFQPRRRYDGGAVAAHSLGYVGEITQAQLQEPRFEGRKPGDIVGRSGLEWQYDAFLQGRDGIRRVIVNNFGREMDTLGELKPVPGNDLYTTLDLDMQLAAEQALGDRTGVAVAMMPGTGEILALASLPAFDPTLFAGGIGVADWDRLVSDPRKPMQNRAIQNHYSPGSVFKVFMTAAGLEEDLIASDEVLFCQGSASFYGNTFGCWKGGGHGRISLHDALVHSCNVFFYNVGDRLGIDRISEYAMNMGLGRQTGVDLPGEDPGLIPSEEWRQRVSGTRWYPGETISVSIGQGPVDVTPLQLTWAIGGLASGGELTQPHLVDPRSIREVGVEASDLTRQSYTVSDNTVDVIRRAMWGVVNEPGTGTRARVQGFEVAGKTGTAQVVAKDAYGTRDEFEDHAWFVGFAPYDDPEIVVGVFVENGGHGGSAAAPVAQAVMQVYFDKKLGRFTRSPSNEIVGLNTTNPSSESARLNN
jgi:penicillin-binding protein 2